MGDDNRRWCLRWRPEGSLTSDVFELVIELVDESGEGEVLVRVLVLSLDPVNRVWISGLSYWFAVVIDAVMDGFVVGKVVRSRAEGIPEGMLVTGDLGWQDYATRSADQVRKFPHDNKWPVSQYLGVLGVTGLTAYFGLLGVGKAKPKEMVLVSGAAGAMGSVVVQIAKMWSCRVVGIVGIEVKCKWLIDLGVDAMINYREQDVRKALKETCPEGVDLYFDNVGGSILEVALFVMRQGGRIVCCGAISSYDDNKPSVSPRGIPGLFIAKRLTMRGFVITDFERRFSDGIAVLAGWIESGHVQVCEDCVKGLENVLIGLMGLLAGENIGKRYVHVADQD